MVEQEDVTGYEEVGENEELLMDTGWVDDNGVEENTALEQVVFDSAVVVCGVEVYAGLGVAVVTVEELVEEGKGLKLDCTDRVDAF